MAMAFKRPKVQESSLLHRKKAQPNAFSIATQFGFKYRDGLGINPFNRYNITSRNPHFILKDRTGQARFVIEYKIDGDDIKVIKIC